MRADVLADSDRLRHHAHALFEQGLIGGESVGYLDGHRGHRNENEIAWECPQTAI